MKLIDRRGSIGQRSVRIMRHSTQFMRENLMQQRHLPCLPQPGFTLTGLALMACLMVTGVRATGAQR